MTTQSYKPSAALMCWSFLIATLFGLGSSLTAVANFGQTGESLGYKPETIHTFMSLISIWNFFGRVFYAFVSETLLMRDQIRRPLMVTIVLVIATTGYLLIAFPGALYIASVIIGFTLGAQLPLVYSIISEIFGLKYYSILFNFGQLASPLGSYLLTVKVTECYMTKRQGRTLQSWARPGPKGRTSPALELIVLRWLSSFWLQSHSYRLSIHLFWWREPSHSIKVTYTKS